MDDCLKSKGVVWILFDSLAAQTHTVTGYDVIRSLKEVCFYHKRMKAATRRII